MTVVILSILFNHIVSGTSKTCPPNKQVDNKEIKKRVYIICRIGKTSRLRVSPFSTVSMTQQSNIARMHLQNCQQNNTSNCSAYVLHLPGFDNSFDALAFCYYPISTKTLSV